MTDPRRWASLVCKLKGHRLEGPENEGRILCARCGDVFNANMLRAFDRVLIEQGQKPILRAD